MNEPAFGASIFAFLAYVIGAVLFVRRAMARERETSARLGLCRSCGYSLAGLPTPVVCPECGTATESPAPAPIAVTASTRKRVDPNLATLCAIPAAIVPLLPILIAVCGTHADAWLFVGVVVVGIPYAILAAAVFSQVRRVKPLPFAVFTVGVSTVLTALSIWCFHGVLLGTDAQSGLSMLVIPVLGSPLVLATFGVFVLLTQHPRFKRHPSQR